MVTLLSILKSIPEYSALLESLSKGQSAAVTGIGQINRSHLIAGLRQDTSAPIVILCQDDLAAKRLQEELKAFLGEAAPVLPSRELTLYDTAVVSRAWEQQRLRQLRLALEKATDPEEVWHIKRRIAELTPMLTQMNELAELTVKYYDRGYWRSEKYTL